MRAVWYERFGAAEEVLEFGEMPAPDPVAGEVRVKLAVSGVNPVDVKRRLGGRGEMSAQRVVPHFDGAGVIDDVGAGVDAARVGERVWIFGAQWQRDFGTAAELFTVPGANAVPLPADASFEAGACLGIPALTAFPAVFADGDVRGKKVLVTGAAGAVGRYAVQFAKLGGAETIATVSNEQKGELAKSAGADHVLNYKHDDIAAAVAEITAGQGVDRIVEVEFGGNITTSVAVLKEGGIIAAYASQAKPTPAVPFYDLMYKSILVRHVLTFQVSDELLRRALADIGRWLAVGSLSHHVGETFALADAVSAHQAVERGTVGKVLLKI
ncbi:MAG: NADPH:quinone reductase [Planctomycetota bacterium]